MYVIITWVSWWLNCFTEKKKQSSTSANCVSVYKYRHREQEGQGGAVQRVSCEAGSEQGQTAEAL